MDRVSVLRDLRDTMPRNDVAQRAFIERPVKAFGPRNFSRKKAQMAQKNTSDKEQGDRSPEFWILRF
jgi:hypothetical protein